MSTAQKPPIRTTLPPRGEPRRKIVLEDLEETAVTLLVKATKEQKARKLLEQAARLATAEKRWMRKFKLANTKIIQIRDSLNRINKRLGELK